jgi:hypothetical protein
MRQDSFKVDKDDVPPLPSLPKPSFSFGLVGSVASPTSSTFSSKPPVKLLESNVVSTPTTTSPIGFPSTSPGSPLTRKQSDSSPSVSGGRDKRKVSIGPQIAPSEWKSQLRKDQVQVKKENQDENVTVSSNTSSELQPPTLSSRNGDPSVSTIISNSSTSTSNQQPFANARSLLRTTKSNFSLGKAALQRSNLRMNHTLNGTSQEGIRDSWIDLGGETDFMRGSSQADAGETQEVDFLKVKTALSNQKEKENKDGTGKEVESQSGWWASLKLRKQKSFAGIGGRNHKGE